MAMNVAEQMSLAEVKYRLSQVVEAVETEHARVTITKHGRKAAVLISADDLQSLEDTLALLSDPAVMEQIRASREELDGDAMPEALSKEEMMGRVRP
jgi:prevent-host-death family protein